MLDNFSFSLKSELGEVDPLGPGYQYQARKHPVIQDTYMISYESKGKKHTSNYLIADVQDKVDKGVWIITTEAIDIEEVVYGNYIGKKFEYYTHSGKLGVATVDKTEIHQELQKRIFIGTTPYGNNVQLTEDEIHRFL